MKFKFKKNIGLLFSVICLICSIILILFVYSCEIVDALLYPSVSVQGPVNNADTSNNGYNKDEVYLPYDYARESTTSPEKSSELSESVENNIKYEINKKFDEYLTINDEVVGYINISGTNIDYPVVYNGDNDYYLYHDIYGKESKYGSVFMDESNRGAVLDRNTIIHGHNFNDVKNDVRDEIFFADLEKYKQKDFFDTHNKIIFNNLYYDMEWEVFSVYVVNKFFGEENYYLLPSFDSEEDFSDYIKLLKSKSIFWNDYEPKEGECILSLHTCSYEFEEAHTIVHAKLVKKTETESERK